MSIKERLLDDLSAISTDILSAVIKDGHGCYDICSNEFKELLECQQELLLNYDNCLESEDFLARWVDIINLYLEYETLKPEEKLFNSIVAKL